MTSSNQLHDQLQASKRIQMAKDWLFTFPLFQIEPVPPLKRHIHKDLHLLMLEFDCQFGKSHVSKAIRDLRGVDYKAGLIAGNNRYDLYLKEDGVVEVKS